MYLKKGLPNVIPSLFRCTKTETSTVPAGLLIVLVEKLRGTFSQVPFQSRGRDGSSFLCSGFLSLAQYPDVK